VFVFTSAGTAGIGAARDTISDFQHAVDKVDLHAFMAGGSFVTSGPFTAANQVRYNAITGVLTGSTDGDTAAEWAVLLVNKPVMTAVDFVF
jgi:Ca2+-binding RTX toxin-like protein